MRTTSCANEAKASSLCRRSVQGVAAVLHDDDLSPESLNVRQRFDKTDAVLRLPLLAAEFLGVVVGADLG